VEDVGGYMNDAGMNARADNPSAIALKKFRERAKLSMEKLATAAGFKSASGIQRYESPVDRTSPYIPMDVVERLAEALVGHGKPPITEIEVFQELAGGLPHRLLFGAGPAEPPSLHVTSSKASKLPDGSRGLALYTEERVAVRLALTPEAIRSIREDLDFLESVLADQ
jgi:transcriptional regulator with XRE-family HTH domain